MPHRVSRSHFAVVTEVAHGPCPALVHEAWGEAFPWLIQGTTRAGDAARPFDLGLFSGGSPEAEIRDNWRALAEGLGVSIVVHASQPHGRQVRLWRGPGEETQDPLVLVDPCDGHLTDRAGALLAVTVADCVPVFIVDPRRQAVAMVHAGWRGAADGILGVALEAMAREFATRPADVHVHLGPSICGGCYEVGPEVHQALDQPVPAGPTPIDLRAILGERAAARGVSTGQVSVSAHCTLCGDAGLFSHRGGDAQRQVGYLGIRR